MQVGLRLGEVGHFEVYVCELVIKHPALVVLQLYLVPDFVFGLVLGKSEIEDAYQIHGSQLVVPIPFLGLFLDRERGIVQGPVLKIVLLGFLHLYDEALTIFANAVQVKDGFAVSLRVAKLLSAGVCQVLNLVLSRQYLVQKVNQQVFVGLRTKQFFEAEIRKRVDVFILERHERRFCRQNYGKRG